MLPLALISNPGPPQRNPVAFTGPSITFAPFSPLSKISLDLFGAGWRSPRKNPPDTVAFNVFTCEARRYHGCPVVEALAAAGEGMFPVQSAPGWARCGPWLSRGDVRINPVDVDFDAFVGERPPSSWAYLTLEIIWATRQQDTFAFEHQPHQLQRPAVRVNKEIFLSVYRRGEQLQSNFASALRAYERWKEAVRRAGLERFDAYDFDHQYGGSGGASRQGRVVLGDAGTWFAFDLPLALDYIWAMLGDPHPLEHPRVGGGPGMGEARSEELLMGAPRIDPISAAAIDAELEISRRWGGEPSPDVRDLTPDQIRMRAEAVRAGIDPDAVSPLPGDMWGKTGAIPAGAASRYRARLQAVRPQFDARRRAIADAEAAAQQMLPAPIEEAYETPLERYRREYAAWRVGGGAGAPPQLPGGRVTVMPREREEFVDEPPLSRPAPTRSTILDSEHSWNRYVARKEREWAEEAPVEVATAPIDLPPAPRVGADAMDPLVALRELHRRVGSQGELARLLKTTQAMVSQWLSGKFRPAKRKSLERIFGLYSQMIAPVEMSVRSTTAQGPGSVALTTSGHSGFEPRFVDARLAAPETRTKLTAGVRAWLLRQRDEHLVGVSDLDVERAANLKAGWIAKARAQAARGGKLQGRLDAWRRFRAYLLTVVPGSVSEVMPRFNPGSLGALIDPSRPRRRNRDSKWKSPPKVREVERDEFQWWGEPEKEQLADQKYKRFHSTQASKVKIYQIPDGKKAVTRDPNLYVGLHETIEVPYQVPWESQKRGENAKEPIVWFHEFPKDSRPLEVLNPTTGITSKLGGTYLVDDYWYS